MTRFYDRRKGLPRRKKRPRHVEALAEKPSTSETAEPVNGYGLITKRFKKDGQQGRLGQRCALRRGGRTRWHRLVTIFQPIVRIVAENRRIVVESPARVRMMTLWARPQLEEWRRRTPRCYSVEGGAVLESGPLDETKDQEPGQPSTVDRSTASALKKNELVPTIVVARHEVLRLSHSRWTKHTLIQNHY